MNIWTSLLIRLGRANNQTDIKMEQSLNEKPNGTFLPRTKGAGLNKLEVSFPFSYLIISFKYKT